MTIQEMKEKKQERGYTYALMSELSGVPLGTLQKIFSRFCADRNLQWRAGDRIFQYREMDQRGYGAIARYSANDRGIIFFGL